MNNEEPRKDCTDCVHGMKDPEDKPCNTCLSSFRQGLAPTQWVEGIPNERN